MEFKTPHLKIESKKTCKIPIRYNKVKMKLSLSKNFLNLFKEANVKSLWILNRIWINILNKMILKTNFKLNKKW